MVLPIVTHWGGYVISWVVGVRAAIQQDRRKRLDMAKPDAVRTLFFWGFAVDEQLTERLAFHKQNGVNPFGFVKSQKSKVEVLPFSLDISQPFSQADFEEAISIPHQNVDFKVVPSGREIFGEMLQALDECAKKLAFALLPIVESYPMPFYRLEER